MIASTSAAALGVSAQLAHAADDEPAADRECYELREYTFDNDDQRERFDRFMRVAAIPALNRIDIRPVGVFHSSERERPVFVLLRHPSINSVATMIERMAGDAEFVKAGDEFLHTPSNQPGYRRITTSLLLAFRGMPKLELPSTAPGRVIQLRIYESHSTLAGQKKIEMFNDAGEIRIFREAGLHPVFFGEAIAGPRMPNLTYMLAFDSDQEREANWQTFINHPEWKRISAMPEYANERIISNVTNLILRPAEYSQI